MDKHPKGSNSGWVVPAPPLSAPLSPDWPPQSKIKPNGTVYVSTHLLKDDQRLLREVKHKLEREQQRIITASEILRIGLRQLAASLGVR
jgi:hypothetical protein